MPFQLRSALLGASVCLSVSASAQSATPKIAIPFTGPHPVINDIIVGFKARVSSQIPGVTFLELHAQGEADKYSSTVLAAIRSRPDLIAPITTPITKLVVQEAGGRVPIVFMGVTDPVGAGVANSLKRPGRATGSSDLCPFEPLLRIVGKLAPKVHTIGLPYNPADQPAVFGRGVLLAAAPNHGLTIVDRQITSPTLLETETRGLASRTDALLIAADNMMMENPAAISATAAATGKPTFACDEASVEKGAVAGVSVSYRQVGEAAGDRAVQVLRGAKPDTLPVIVLNTANLIVNLDAACRVGLSVDTATLSGARFIGTDAQCEARHTAIPPTAAWVFGAAVLLFLLVLAMRRRARTPVGT